MKIFGDWESSYEILPQYLEALKSSNLGTVTATYFDHMSYRMVQFRRVFWAFGPSIEGFTYYRPILSIDDTHLYEKYKGCLLIATGVNADGGLYRLASAVVEGETESSWRWFISRIYELIPTVHQNRRITFISDQRKEIPNALRRG